MARKVDIVTSKQENTKRDEYKIKHFSNGVNINTMESGQEIQFNKMDILHVVDDENGDDYNVTVLRGANDEIFYTSSEYFTREVDQITDDFKPDEDGIDGMLVVKVLKKPSRNRKGQNGEPVLFLTCELV